MGKPLFRWTVGHCLQQGLDILVESFDKTINCLGEDKFDWFVCYNGLSVDQVRFISSKIGNRRISLMSQNWADCPIPDICWSPARSDGSFEWNGGKCGGTLWKVTPPRIRMDSHEIIMDNDIILLKKFSQIEEFLNSDKVMLLEEPIRFYGRYDNILPKEEPYFNSGFIGLPPMYDFGADIFKHWEENGKLEKLTHADEQGLLTYALYNKENIRIHKDQMIEVLGRDYSYKHTGQEEALHFTQSNRMPNHYPWKNYLGAKNG